MSTNQTEEVTTEEIVNLGIEGMPFPAWQNGLVAAIASYEDELVALTEMCRFDMTAALIAGIPGVIALWTEMEGQ